ncbi:MAG: DUF1501 domain-containing protein [Polyangiaceae bacterium]|nr:DUF1501 domain-containing protein [Polyangiaceae bacterium]
MNRRDVLKLLSLAGLATIGPIGVSAVSAAEPVYKGPFWIMLNAGGGWDPTILCDPKGGTLKDPANPDEGYTDDSVNHFEKGIDVGPFKAAPVNWAQDFDGTVVELYSSEKFLTEHGKRLLVVNGVDTQTNNHEVGNRVTWSGRPLDGQPALAALLAAFGAQDKDLPLAFMSSGGYDATAGVVALARAEANLRVVQRVAYPNVINVENLNNPDDPPQTYHTQETMGRIYAAQAERLQGMSNREILPTHKKGMDALFLARQGSGSLGALADELANVDPVTVPKAFPDEFGALDQNAFGGDFRNLLQQAQLALHAFHAGVAVAANMSIGGFDTHSAHDNDQSRQMMKLLKAYSYIWKLAAELGIENNLYVVVGSDFGRTPYYNEGNGKDHWNTTSMLLAGPQIEGNRVIGATDDGFRPMRVDPKDVTKILPDDDKAGVRIEPHHIHRELRRVAGLEGTSLDTQWGLPGDGLPLLG